MTNSCLSREELRSVLESLRETQAASCMGTSLVSLAVPAGYNLALTSQLLTKEYGTSSCIKSRV